MRTARTRSNFVTAATLFLLAGSASAQSVLVGDFPTGWSNVAGNLDAGSMVQGTSGAPGVITGGVTRDGTGVILRLNAFATENGDATRDRFITLSLSSQNFFTLNANADISLPTFFNGDVLFNGALGPPNMNFAVGRASARIQLHREGVGGSGNFNTLVLDSDANALTQFRLGPTTAQGSPGGSNANLFHFLQANNLPFQDGAGNTINYRVTANLLIDGEADQNFARNSAAGAQVTVDFVNGLSRGLVTSIGSRPAGFNSDSRSAVDAINARNVFGVTGVGVPVGVVEPGRINSNHLAFEGAGKVTQRGGADATFNEHTTMVASIIAGNDSVASNAQRGVAPGATLISDPTFTGGVTAAVNDAIGAGARVVNMSAGGGNLNANSLDGIINANPRVTFVKSAGNASGVNNNPTDPGNGGSNVTVPGLANNIITVGALNRNFTRRADFSSFNNGLAGNVMKPDIVAPGEYVTGAITADLSEGGLLDDYDNRFAFSDYKFRNTASPTSGEVAGTSFAAPHVAGAAALMMNYRDTHMGGGANATHDATADDHRVIKAVMLNSANTNGIFHKDGATAWRQASTGSAGAQNLRVTESLDRELGSGMLNVFESLRTYSAPESRLADNNTDQHFKITPRAGTGLAADRSWDLDRVNQATGAGIDNAGTVDYLIGLLAPGTHFRATLTWDLNAATSFLANLELRFYAEGSSDFNTAGFVPGMDPEQQDFLLGRTDNASENVKILDFIVPDAAVSPQGYYLQVANFSQMGGSIDYGIAFVVPSPTTGASMLTLVGIVALRRRRQA